MCIMLLKACPILSFLTPLKARYYHVHLNRPIDRPEMLYPLESRRTSDVYLLCYVNYVEKETTTKSEEKGKRLYIVYVNSEMVYIPHLLAQVFE